MHPFWQHQSMTDQGAARTRLFSSTYSELRQRSARNTGSDTWSVELLGRLRLDALLFRRIVLPFGYLSDGTWFLSQDPSRLLRSLSPLPDVETFLLEVRANEVNYSSALLAQLRRAVTASTFCFDSIRDLAVQQELGAAVVSDFEDRFDAWMRRSPNPIEAAASWVQHRATDIGVDDDEDVVRLVDGWRSWGQALERDRSGLIQFRPWSPSDLFLEGLNLSCPPQSDLSPLEREVLAEISRSVEMGKPLLRANIRLIFRRWNDSVSDPADLALLEWLELYVEQAWERGAALSSTASFGYEPLSSDVRPTRVEMAEGSGGDWDGIFPPAFLGSVGLLDESELGQFQVDQRANLTEWWASGDRSSLLRALSDLGSRLRQGKQGSNRSRARDIFVAVGSASAGAISSEATRPLIHGSSGSLLTAGITAGVTALGSRLFSYSSEAAAGWWSERELVRLVEYFVDVTSSSSPTA